jgi:hypothetical protein
MCNFVVKISNKIAVFLALITVFMPNKGLAELSRRLSWMAFSSYERPQIAIVSVGIGGLQVNVNQKIDVSSSGLSHKNGYLYVKLKNRALQIPVSSIELNEAIQLIQNSNERIFETSIDQLLVAGAEKGPLVLDHYSSKPLRGTNFLRKLFLSADQQFADLVQNSIHNPATNIKNPFFQALVLLNTDTQYQALPNQWIGPPLSWPQLYMVFDPNAQGLISLKFKPQVLFRSSSRYPVEVNSQIQSLGEKPYQSLRKDIKKRSNLYREALPIVDRAANITAVLGLVSSACSQPRSCQHLLVSPAGNEESQLREKYTNVSKSDQQSIKRLENRWDELRLREFQPSQSPKSWAAAYDAVWIAIENPNLKNKALNIAARQFLTQAVPPNDALLQAAASVVFVAQGGQENFAKAQQSIDKAIKISSSSNYFVEQNKVARLGLAISRISNSWLSEEAMRRNVNLTYLRSSSTLQLYKYIDSYLENCLKNPSSCTSEDLRTKEVNTASIYWQIPLFRKRDIDTAWVYGRFAYLVALNEPGSRINRLRLLSHYADLAKTEERRQKLRLLAMSLSKV